MNDLQKKIIELTKNSNKESNSLKPIKTQLFSAYSGNDISKMKLSEVGYCVLHDHASKRCPVCKKKYRFLSFKKGYHEQCSTKKCELLRQDNLKTKEQLKELLTTNINLSTPELNALLLNNGFLSTLYNHTKILGDKASISERIYFIYYDLKNRPNCHYCNKKSVKYNNFTLGYFKYCGSSCSFKATEEDRKKTNLDKYGVSNTFRLESHKERQNASLRSKEVINKTRRTRIEKGVNEKVSEKVRKKWSEKSSEELKEHSLKIQNGKMEKYGVPFYTNIDKIKETRLKNTFLKKIKIIEKLGITPLFELKDYNGVIKNKYDWKCKRCGLEFSQSISNGLYPACKRCDRNTIPSKPELEIGQFLKSINIKVKTEDRKILEGLELDYLIDNHNIAIEFNGSYYHSQDKLNKKYSSRIPSLLKEYKLGSNVGIYYHLLKTKMAIKKEINLIHINEYEWINPLKKEIWKSMLRYKFNLITEKIYARKCHIKEVSNEESYMFLEENHLQGNVNSSIRLGLYFNNKLISLMTLGKDREGGDYDYEIYRFCSKLNTNVIGAGSKLFEFFIKRYNPNKVLSYADRRFSSNSFYKQLGFDLKGISKPGFVYVKNKNVYSRKKFQKHKLQKLYNQGFLQHYDPELTGDENMRLNSFNKIYDCGNWKFVWSKEKK
jgi:rubrerythrin